MKRHFVTFYSPGTFVSETTTKAIDSWDVDKAVKMADEITERYNATPYAFQFETRERADNDLDSHASAKSNLYYLGGNVQSDEEVLSGTDPKDEILRNNVRINKYKRIITNTNSWKITRPLNDEDVVLDYIPMNQRGKP